MNATARALAQNDLFTAEWLYTISKQYVLLMLLTAIVVMSAFALIYVKDLNRRLTYQYQTSVQTENALQQEWGQLLLEKATWVQQSRIQSIATNQLNMILPDPGKVVLVKE